jgi:hypothetical protein
MLAPFVATFVIGGPVSAGESVDSAWRAVRVVVGAECPRDAIATTIALPSSIGTTEAARSFMASGTGRDTGGSSGGNARCWNALIGPVVQSAATEFDASEGGMSTTMMLGVGHVRSESAAERAGTVTMATAVGGGNVE